VDRVSDTRFLAEVLVTMLVIMDPVGNVPIFLSVTRRLSASARNRAALVAVVTAAAVIGVFAILGRQVLDYLDVSVPALQGAGGLLLLLVALELLTGSDRDEADALDPDDHVDAADRSLIALAIAGVLLAVYLAMRFSGLLIRLLRNSGILLLSRIAGLLLAAIAVQMLADAVIAFARQI